MKSSIYKYILFCLIVQLLAAAAVAQQAAYSYVGDPSPQEQYMLELINRARAYPAAEGIFLSDISDSTIRGLYKYFQIDLPQLRSDFKSYAPQPPLAFNSELINLARRHSHYMIDQNVQDHDETDTSDPFYTGATSLDRIKSVFPNLWLENENIAAYALNIDFAHAGLLVDWGVPDLAHRDAIMGLKYENKYPEPFNQVGIGVLSNKGIGKIGPLVITQDFLLDSQVFLTGVVYQDPNHKGLYQPGEGMGGITIRPSSGNFYAVTSRSGGFAIPIDPSSVNETLSITASGPGLAAPMTKMVVTTGKNVKIDFVPDWEPTPIVVTALTPSISGAVGAAAPTGFLITRTANLDSVLDLNYLLKGNAVNGIDYQKNSGTLEFPAGVAKMIVRIKPKSSDPAVEKKVILKIKASAANQSSNITTVSIGG